MNDPTHDPLSARFALAILVVVGALLITIAVRADEPVAAELERAPALQEPPDIAPEGPAVDPADLTARALAWVDRRSDAAFRFGPVGVRRGWPGRAWVGSELVPAALQAAQGARFPDAWPDAELLLAKAWWESRWRPGEVGRFVVRNGRVVPGRGGEVGVLQIKPRVCRRYVQAGEDCADTRVNMRIAATILREHLVTCEGRPRFALRFYATGRGCAPPRYAEKTVTVWAQQLRETR